MRYVEGSTVKESTESLKLPGHLCVCSYRLFLFVKLHKHRHTHFFISIFYFKFHNIFLFQCFILNFTIFSKKINGGGAYLGSKSVLETKKASRKETLKIKISILKYKTLVF